MGYVLINLSDITGGNVDMIVIIKKINTVE